MTETDPLGLAKHVLEVHLEKDHRKSRPAATSTAILSALIAVHDAVERNTAVLEAAHKPVETSINYGTVVNDVEKLREQAKAVASYGGRKITGTANGDEGVAMTSDTPFWTAPKPFDPTEDVRAKAAPDAEAPVRALETDAYVNPDVPTTIGGLRAQRPLAAEMGPNLNYAYARPTVVADVHGDKPLEPEEYPNAGTFRNVKAESKISDVTVTEGANPTTPPRVLRGTRNVIIGTDEEDVLEFTGRAPGTYFAPEWIAVWPGREDRIRGVTVGDWISTAAASHTGSAAVRALIGSVKARQKPTFATGGRIEGPPSGSDSIPAWLSGTDFGYRLTSEQVKNAGKGILDAINRGALKPSTDIETTAAQLNAQHLGRRITVHRSRCNNYADVSGELTEIEYTSSPDTIGHSIELDHGRRYAIEVTWPVTVHTDYPDIAIGNEA